MFVAALCNVQMDIEFCYGCGRTFFCIVQGVEDQDSVWLEFPLHQLPDL
jgi:hypothetical protein